MKDFKRPKRVLNWIVGPQRLSSVFNLSLVKAESPGKLLNRPTPSSVYSSTDIRTCVYPAVFFALHMHYCGCRTTRWESSQWDKSHRDADFFCSFPRFMRLHWDLYTNGMSVFYFDEAMFVPIFWPGRKTYTNGTKGCALVFLWDVKYIHWDIHGMSFSKICNNCEFIGTSTFECLA